MSPSDRFRSLTAALGAAVIGQPQLVQRLLIALLADGHLLIEGAPGLAKTRAARTLAALIDADFARIQFTPDLLPADLTGSDIFRPQDGTFQFEPGPLFHRLLLADEINRAPAKVQSALLEAMGERQITVGRRSYPLPEPFLVLATQNPLEHEGTYPLPEAQLDRFLLHVRVDYPDAAAERAVLALARREARAGRTAGGTPAPVTPILDLASLSAARQEVLDLHLSPDLETYLVTLVAATRAPERVCPAHAGAVRYGASPRASLALERSARAHAWLAGRDYVSPADLQALAPDVLRHRVGLSYEAEATGLSVDRLLGDLIAAVPVP